MQAATRPTLTAAEYLEGVRALLEPIRAAAPEIEEARRLPPHIERMVRDAGMFAVGVPKDWGGLELDPVTQLEGIELLATADASAAWAAMIGCDTGYVLGFFENAAARELFTDTWRSTAFVGSPSGIASVVDGGYKVSGRWTFASGCTHSAVFLLACVATTEQGPRMATERMPEVRVVALPAEQAQILDTWTTTGVRGSGSHDIAVDSLFVPESHSFRLFPSEMHIDGGLYRYPFLFTFKLAAVALGIARGAIDDVIALSATKTAYGSRTLIRDKDWLQVGITRAEIAYGQARAFYHEAMREIWQEMSAGNAPSKLAQAKLNAAQVGAVERSIEVVDAMYKAGGSNALYSKGTLDRRLRDVHTAGQHTVLQDHALQESGRVYLGIHPESSMMIR